MAEVLTEDIACEELQKIFDRNSAPLIIFGTGTSCAVDETFGMQALRCHLENKIGMYKLVMFKQQWTSNRRLNNGIDFVCYEHRCRRKIMQVFRNSIPINK